jgi:hypothetical protein
MGKEQLIHSRRHIMKKRIFVTSAMFSILLIFCGTAFAARSVDQRQAKQRARITQGVRTGSVNRHEFKELRRDQRRIQVAKHHARRDGHVSPGEMNRIHRMQDRASAKIYRAKTNHNYHYGPVRHKVRHYKPYHRPAPVCVVPAPHVVYHGGSYLSGAVIQPGFSMALSVGLD